MKIPVLQRPLHYIPAATRRFCLRRATSAKSGALSANPCNLTLCPAGAATSFSVCAGKNRLPRSSLSMRSSPSRLRGEKIGICRNKEPASFQLFPLRGKNDQTVGFLRPTADPPMQPTIRAPALTWTAPPRKGGCLTKASRRLWSPRKQGISGQAP